MYIWRDLRDVLIHEQWTSFSIRPHLQRKMPPFSPTSHMAVDSLSTLIPTAIGGEQYLD